LFWEVFWNDLACTIVIAKGSFSLQRELLMEFEERRLAECPGCNVIDVSG
jgi:hypothetical protein